MSLSKEFYTVTHENLQSSLRQQIDFLTALTQQGFTYLEEDDLKNILNLLEVLQDTVEETVDQAESDYLEKIEEKWEDYREALEARYPVGSVLHVDRQLSQNWSKVDDELDVRGKYIVQKYGNPYWAGESEMKLELQLTISRLSRENIAEATRASHDTSLFYSIVKRFIKLGEKRFDLTEADVLHFLQKDAEP